MRKVAWLILFLLVGWGMLITGCSSPPPEPSPQIGKLAPDFKLPSIEGQTVSLSDFRGKPVLLNFWASWCESCRLEMPFLQKLHEEWSDRGLVVLGINLGESAPRVERFAESKGLSFLMLLDTNQDVALRYNIRAIPTTFFIDKDGIIQDIRIGAISSEGEMERRLSKIIPWLERKGG